MARRAAWAVARLTKLRPAANRISSAVAARADSSAGLADGTSPPGDHVHPPDRCERHGQALARRRLAQDRRREHPFTDQGVEPPVDARRLGGGRQLNEGGEVEPVAPWRIGLGVGPDLRRERAEARGEHLRCDVGVARPILDHGPHRQDRGDHLAGAGNLLHHEAAPQGRVDTEIPAGGAMSQDQTIRPPDGRVRIAGQGLWRDDPEELRVDPTDVLVDRRGALLDVHPVFAVARDALHLREIGLHPGSQRRNGRSRDLGPLA